MDGILYWNHAFGKDIVEAKKAPAGVTAPDADYNVIQWVPWDNAGFAYADDLMDPHDRPVAARAGLHHERLCFHGPGPGARPVAQHGGNGRAKEGEQEERGAP